MLKVNIEVCEIFWIVPKLVNVAAEPPETVRLPLDSRLTVAPASLVKAPLAVTAVARVAVKFAVPQLLRPLSRTREEPVVATLSVPLVSIVTSPVPVIVPLFQLKVLPAPVTMTLPAPSSVPPASVRVPFTVELVARVNDAPELICKVPES